MKVLRLSAVLAAVLALLFVGCGDDDDGDGGGGTGGDTRQVSEARAQGAVTWSIGKDTTGAFSTVVENFNEAYPDANVELLELLYSAGGDVVNEDGSEATADSEEVRDVLTFMRSGITDGAVPKAVTTYMEEESRRAFESGRATFMRNWPYAYSLGKDSDIADDFEVTTFPAYDGNEGAGVLGGYDLAISAFSENPEGSLAFIEFATNPEQQVIQATEASLPPVLTEVYDDAEVQEALPFATELRDAVAQGRPRPVSPVYPQISEAIYTNVYAALQGNKSAEQAATDMNEEIQSALETF